ncbi:MAG: YjgP/YjgQ family permease [Firmicutes bacterium]|nr:YjgP/YjgQ family permease [Bacillota bacterium]
MGIKLLDKYAVKEFLGPFVACVGGITILLISGYLFELSDLVFVKRVPFAVVLQLLGYRIPAVLTLTLPIGVLFATFLSLGRFVKDNELTVMLCAGHRLARFALPYLVIGLAVSGITLAANEHLVPYTNHREANILRRLVLQDGLPVIEEKVFFKDPDNRFFYINRVDRDRNLLSEVMIYVPNPESDFPTLITARTGEFRDNLWHLQNGIQREFDSQGYLRREVVFATLDIVTEEPAEAYLGKQKTTEEMNRRELREHIAVFEASGIKVDSFVVDYHLKLALPGASLIFVLLAVPFGFHSGRGGRFFAVLVGLGIVFLYYAATSIFRSMGANGILATGPAAWLSNILFGGVGAAAILWLERR